MRKDLPAEGRDFSPMPQNNRNFEAHQPFTLYELMIELHLAEFHLHLEEVREKISRYAKTPTKLYDGETTITILNLFGEIAGMCRGEGDTIIEKGDRPYLPETKKRTYDLLNSRKSRMRLYVEQELLRNQNPNEWELLHQMDAIVDPPFLRGGEIEAAWNSIEAGFQLDLKAAYLFQLTHEEVQYYIGNTNYAFDTATIAKFNIAEDASEAAKCYAFERYTACVFHIMRCLERIVQVLALNYLGEKELDVEKEAWDKLLRRIRKGLGDHTNAGESDRDNRIREICISLDSIRGIWRNPTAHPRHHYTFEESRSIFSLSRIVAKQIAEVI